MLFAVIFTDKPGCCDIRAAQLSAHIAWLEAHKDIIPVGGSLRAEPGTVPKGGLWLAEAESKAQIEALLQTDPFFTAGLRQSYEILHWSNRLLKYSPSPRPTMRLSRTIEAPQRPDRRARHARSRHLHREPVHHAPPR
ncbi:YciI family protein [Acidovorax temperans]|uniref:YciI family protein n=1 Tax=Acidovorax temperans TaxID=80878 RepID=UPI0035B00207